MLEIQQHAEQPETKFQETRITESKAMMEKGPTRLYPGPYGKDGPVPAGVAGDAAGDGGPGDDKDKDDDVKHGATYDFEDLLSVQLINKDLKKFIIRWDSVITGMVNEQNEIDPGSIVPHAD